MNSKQQRVADAEANFDAFDLDSVCELVDAIKARETETAEHATYHVDTDTELYGDNCEDGQACAEAIAEHLTAYAAKRGLAVDIEVSSGQSNSTSDISDADRAIIRELDETSEIRWTEWVPMTAFNA